MSAFLLLCDFSSVRFGGCDSLCFFVVNNCVRFGVLCFFVLFVFFVVAKSCVYFGVLLLCTSLCFFVVTSVLGIMPPL